MGECARPLLAAESGTIFYFRGFVFNDIAAGKCKCYMDACDGAMKRTQTVRWQMGHSYGIDFHFNTLFQNVRTNHCSIQACSTRMYRYPMCVPNRIKSYYFPHTTIQCDAVPDFPLLLFGNQAMWHRFLAFKNFCRCHYILQKSRSTHDQPLAGSMDGTSSRLIGQTDTRSGHYRNHLRNVWHRRPFRW